MNTRFRKRNTISQTDDMETLRAKLEAQAEAQAKKRNATNAKRLRVLAAAVRMMERVDQNLTKKYGRYYVNFGRMNHAADGDTLYVREITGLVRIRLYGIDAPELDQPFGPEAQEFLNKWKYHAVQWDVVRADKWGRCVAIVYPREGPSLNARLIEAGLAWVDPAHCGREICGRWREIEAKARESRRGLWVQHNPESPWQHRGGKDDD